MPASAICMAVAAGVVATFWSASPSQAMTARPIGILTAEPEMNLIEPSIAAAFRMLIVEDITSAEAATLFAAVRAL